MTPSSATAPAPRAVSAIAVPDARSAPRVAAPPPHPSGATSPSASLSGVRRPPDGRPPLAAAPQPALSPRAVDAGPAHAVSLSASSVPRM
jgi:hypothetical protein